VRSDLVIDPGVFSMCRAGEAALTAVYRLLSDDPAHRGRAVVRAH
jgi:hypothetical protein